MINLACILIYVLRRVIMSSRDARMMMHVRADVLFFAVLGLSSWAPNYQTVIHSATEPDFCYAPSGFYGRAQGR